MTILRASTAWGLAIAAAVIGFFATTTAAYVSVQSAGDPVALIRIGFRNVPPSAIQEVESYLNSGYSGWLANLLTGNLGVSMVRGSLAAVMPSWIGATLELILPSLVIGAVLGTFFGTLSSRRHGYALRMIALLLLGGATFWLGAMLIYLLALQNHVFPAAGIQSPLPPYWGGSQLSDQLSHLVLPLTATSLTSFAAFAVIAGLSARRVAYLPLRGAMKVAVGSVLRSVGPIFAVLLSVSVGVETVFTWPGLGFAGLESELNLDLVAVLSILGVASLLALLGSYFGGFAFLASRSSSGRRWRVARVGAVWHTWKGKAAFLLASVTVFIVLWGAFFAPYPERSFACLTQGCANLPPFTDAAHPFGTEPSGVDVFSETLHGVANDFGFAVAAAAVALLVGSFLGWLSRQVSLVKHLVRGGIYFVLALPFVLTFGWFARVTILQTTAGLAFATTVEFGIVGALLVAFMISKSDGESDMRSVLSSAIPAALLVAGLCFLVLEYLGFLGFLPPNTTSIGLLLSEGLSYISSSPWIETYPGLVGSFAVFSLLFLSDVFYQGGEPPAQSIALEPAPPGFVPTPVAMSEPYKSCPNCGIGMPASSRFCPNCGVPQTHT